MKNILIITALAKEREAVEKLLDSYQRKTKGILTYSQGILNNKSITIIEAGIGKVNVAIATSIAIETFNPDLIINCGIACGYISTLNTLDVVVAKETLYYDVDLTSDQFPYGQLQGLPLTFKLINDFDELFNKLKLANTQSKIIFGTIATGDQFVTDYEKMDKLVKQYFPNHNIVAFDMESASIAHTCYLYHKPLLIIRSISDCLASPNNAFDYHTFSVTASLVSANIIKEIINTNN